MIWNSPNLKDFFAQFCLFWLSGTHLYTVPSHRTQNGRNAGSNFQRLFLPAKQLSSPSQANGKSSALWRCAATCVFALSLERCCRIACTLWGILLVQLVQHAISVLLCLRLYLKHVLDKLHTGLKSSKLTTAHRTLAQQVNCQKCTMRHPHSVWVSRSLFQGLKSEVFRQQTTTVECLHVGPGLIRTNNTTCSPFRFSSTNDRKTISSEFTIYWKKRKLKERNGAR